MSPRLRATAILCSVVLAVSGCGVWFDDANGEDRERLERLLADPVWELAPPGMTVADSRAGAPTGELTTGTGKGEIPVNSVSVAYDLPDGAPIADALAVYLDHMVGSSWGLPSSDCHDAGAAFVADMTMDGYEVRLTVRFRSSAQLIIVDMVAPHHSRDEFRSVGAGEPVAGVDCLVEAGLLDAPGT